MINESAGHDINKGLTFGRMNSAQSKEDPGDELRSEPHSKIDILARLGTFHKVYSARNFKIPMTSLQTKVVKEQEESFREINDSVEMEKFLKNDSVQKKSVQPKAAPASLTASMPPPRYII